MPNRRTQAQIDRTGGYRCSRRLLAALWASLVIWLPLSLAAAQTAACPRPDALGTSRVLQVDAASTPQVGLKSFPQTLPLADHEVVLTFDDGPWPSTTKRVLKALADECVRATFFLIGQHVSEHPDLVRRIAAEGHSVGSHTWLHPHTPKLKPEAAVEEIDHGISAIEKALHGVETKIPSTPFFRFPNFESTPATLDLLKSRGIVVFGADFWASDWLKMTPQEELKLITSRLNEAGRGIILFHDTKTWTAAMLPDFLRYLRDNGYHVVHVVPAKTVAAGTP